MHHTGKIDQDDIVRARNILLASGRRTPQEEVDAYRVLARVGPASYLPLLSRALRRLSYDTGSGTWHPDRLALHEEAVAAARAVDPAEPARADVLYEALDARQRDLYDLGRRTEGLAVRAEMLAVGRAQAELSGSSHVKGLRIWANGLFEEGRYAEAADALTESVAASLPEGSRSGALAWSILEWIAALRDAGRRDEALAAFETLIGVQAADAAKNPDATACHVYSLIGYARLLDTYGRGERATLVRREILIRLTELTETRERKSWGSYGAVFWTVLLSFADTEGGHPSGAEPLQWSPDARRRYFVGRHTLREEVDALAPRATENPDEHLPELVRLHRLLTIRSTVYWQNRTHLFRDHVRPLFNESVNLARRLSHHAPSSTPHTLADLLLDRSTFHLAAHELVPALDDFREALRCRGEAG